MGFELLLRNATQCSPEKRVKIPGLDSQGFNLMLGEFVIISHLRSHMSEPIISPDGKSIWVGSE